jgi:hypothetical protein
VADGWTVEAELKRQADRMQPATIPTGSDALSRRSSRGAITASPPDASARANANGHAGSRHAPAGASRVVAASPTPARPKLPTLSKDAYRRQKETLDAELTRLGLRKNHLELELSRPAVQSNFIELRRVSSELADVEVALSSAEDAWLALEERAP